MLRQYLLGAIILLVNHLQHLVVHQLGRGLRVRTLELVFGVVIVADIGQLFTHACKGNHAVCLLRGTLKVVHGTRRDMTNKQLLSSTSA